MRLLSPCLRQLLDASDCGDSESLPLKTHGGARKARKLGVLGQNGVKPFPMSDMSPKRSYVCGDALPGDVIGLGQMTELCTFNIPTMFKVYRMFGS